MEASSMRRKWRLVLIYSIVVIGVIALAIFSMSMLILFHFRSQ